MPPTAGIGAEPRGRLVTLFLGGDVVTGRGVDQILPHPASPRLWEPCARDARAYVELAEAANGPVGRPVGFEAPWGDALRILDDVAPDVRLVNLETSVTTSDDVDEHKRVHYRMNPDNVPCVAAARPDVCVLANNHVLDFGRTGLIETLDVLAGARLTVVGAGRNATEAGEPAVCVLGGDRRVLVFAFGAESAGVPREWAATSDRPGVALLDDLSDETATRIAERVASARRNGDLVVVSLHWGSNWGYEVSRRQRRFARGLVDGGVHVVYGHSSHHPRPIEVYRGRLIVYGCGDLVDDYEGIGGREKYRGDLRLLYFATLDAATGDLAELRMAPMRAHRMRLHRAPTEDAEWMRGILDTISGRFGCRIEHAVDGMLQLCRPA